MPINSETITASADTDGSQTQFTFDFPVFDETHLMVIVRDADGVETEQTLNGDYTIPASSITDAGEDPHGGYVEFDSPPATGQTVFLLLDSPYTQPTSLASRTTIPSATLERMHDRARQQNLQLLRKLDRAVLVSASSPFIQGGGDFVMPEPVDALRILVLNADNELALHEAADLDLATVTSFITTLLDDSTAAAARTTLGVLSEAEVGTAIEEAFADAFIFHPGTS